MNDAENIALILPTAREIACAVNIFLALAYDGNPPPATERFVIRLDSDVADWLMSDVSERSPVDQPIDAVRSFALRIGNSKYPHMKLRLSRPPNQRVYVFTVDSHDAMLKVAGRSADYDELEALKRHNAEIASEIGAAWEQAGLLTEHEYMRQRMRQPSARGGESPERT